MKLINLTPHVVTVRTVNGDIQFQPSGKVARVNMDSTNIDPVHDDITDMDVPVVKVSYGKAELPIDITMQEYHNIGCIVSTMFADAYRAQNGISLPFLFVPDSGPSAIRENNQIVAVRALIAR
jgi:hypothetical protein